MLCFSWRWRAFSYSLLSPFSISLFMLHISHTMIPRRRGHDPIRRFSFVLSYFRGTWNRKWPTCSFPLRLSYFHSSSVGMYIRSGYRLREGGKGRKRRGVWLAERAQDLLYFFFSFMDLEGGSYKVTKLGEAHLAGCFYFQNSSISRKLVA